MNVLVLYHATQTYTNTVFEHINAFARFSSNRYFFCHHEANDPLLVDFSRFDAVVIHYCLRLPYDQISAAAVEKLQSYRGLKALFIQDEYENTRRAWHWIKRLRVDLVFTVVPECSIARIYPPEEFPSTRFVSNLTGYVPESISEVQHVPRPSTRRTLVGYRGRPLPLRYGILGQEKIRIGQIVRNYCERHGLPCDIAWSEESRIYGSGWYPFVASCRAMLGSESGSNLFDWDGDLQARIDAFRREHPASSDEEVLETVVAPLEMHGLMNQVSPRVFEAVAFRTVLVLFEGRYSGVLEPGEHFIPLKKDGSNLDEVFALLQDDAFVDAMADRAWKHVIGSGRYSYPAFVRMVDREMAATAEVLESKSQVECDGPASVELADFGYEAPAPFTSFPIRWPPPSAVQPEATLKAESSKITVGRWSRLRQACVLVWGVLPPNLQNFMRPVVNGILRPAGRAMHGLLRMRTHRQNSRA